jgi:hypothetical protein
MALTIAVKLNVKVDSTLLNKHVAMLALAMRKSMGDIVKEQSRLLCRDLCDFFPPFSGAGPSVTKGGEGGFGNKARNKGRAAVNRDVRKIFAPLAQAKASTVTNYGNLIIFDRWIKAKEKLPQPHEPGYIFRLYHRSGMVTTQADFDYMKQREGAVPSVKGNFLIDNTEASIKSIHERIRGTPHYRVGKNRQPNYFVSDWKVVENYIKKVQYRVGKLKSGWYYAGLRLGFMPTSQWISGHTSTYSTCIPQLTNTATPNVKLGNKIGRLHSQGWNFFVMARNYRALAMRVRIIKVLKNQPGKLLDVAQRLQGFSIT